MKIGVISDTHFGDNTCKLLDNGKISKVYEAFRKEVIKFTGGPRAKKPLSYLVLNGDTLDFSINSFEDSCRKARPFFKAIQEDNIAEKIILIPGNHDKQIWDVVEWERHVTMKMQQHEDPEDFTRTQAALLDFERDLLLPGVSPKPGEESPGGLFLEGLFTKDSAMEAKERKEKHCGYSMSNRLRSQEKVFLGTLRQRRRYQAFRIVSEQEQRDQGGDPDESDQEGQ